MLLKSNFNFNSYFILSLGYEHNFVDQSNEVCHRLYAGKHHVSELHDVPGWTQETDQEHGGEESMDRFRDLPFIHVHHIVCGISRQLYRTVARHGGICDIATRSDSLVHSIFRPICSQNH